MSILGGILSLSLKDRSFNHRWKRVAKGILPANIQLVVRKVALLASFKNGSIPMESDSQGVQFLVREGDFVIDVGANVGTYTKLLSTLVGPSGSVWAFEPLPENHSVLAFITRRLGLSNVTLWSCALSESSGRSRMEIPSFARGESLYDARLASSAESTLRTVEVPLATLDSLLPVSGTTVGFMKIDVEGHELQCLKGSLQTLRRHRPALLIESLDHPAIDGSLSKCVVQFLCAEGYEAWVFTGSGFSKWDQQSHPQNLFYFPAENSVRPESAAQRVPD